MDNSFDFDYIGFMYDSYHSIRDLKIYRTSSGNRYNLFANSSYQDDIYTEGIEGQTFLKSKLKSISFQIPFAFDSLTKEDIKKLKKIFSSTKICEISFDERPYVAYDVKLSQPLKLNYLVFEENGKDIYKGEGNLQLICYDGYGHTPHQNSWENITSVPRLATRAFYPIGLFFPNGIYELWSSNSQNDPSQDNSFNFSLRGFTEEDTQFLLESKITVKEDNIQRVQYQIDNSNGGILVKSILLQDMSNETLYPFLPQVIRKINSDGTYESFAQFDGYGFVCQDKKTLNGYSYGKYPTKFEWANISVLPWYEEKFSNSYNLKQLSITNYGELPMPIKFRTRGNIKISEMKIDIQMDEVKIYSCDTKTGMIGMNKEVYSFKGNSKGFLQKQDILKYKGANDQTIDLPYMASVEYDYLYY